MLRHCVLGAFTDEATDEAKHAMVQALKGMPSSIPQIQALAVGLDAGIAAGNHGFALNVRAAPRHAYASRWLTCRPHTGGLCHRRGLQRVCDASGAR